MNGMKRQPEDFVISRPDEDKIRSLEAALDGVLTSKSIVEAKEIAADALDVDVDEFLVDDLDEEFVADFHGDDLMPEGEW